MFEGSTFIDSIYGFLCPPYEEVGLRQVFVGDDEAQGVHTGQGLSAVRRLFCICHRLLCRWTTRGEGEHGNCHYQGTSPNNLYSHLLYL